MPTRRPDPTRERLWRKRLARWKVRGLTVREFCAREGVAPTAFAHWRKELAARDTRVTSEPTFIPLHITPAFTGPSLDVALLCGRVVRIPPGFDPAHLRAAVAALEGEAC